MANNLGRGLNDALKSGLFGAFMMIGLLAGATFAAAELRSPMRWLVSIAIGSVTLAAFLMPMGSVWQNADELTESSAAILAIVLGLWAALTGGLIGHWLARGEVK